MDLFMATAQAATSAPAVAGSAQDPGFGPMLLLVGFIVVFYFIGIRPQNKRAKEHKNLVAGIQKNDELVTAGGLAGKVVKVMDDYLLLAIANGVEVVVQKSAIATVLPKETLKSMQNHKTAGNRA
jgi:preprotein translocase subunit YajC